MLKRMIIGFAAWFIKPLGYVVIPTKVIDGVYAREKYWRQDAMYWHSLYIKERKNKPKNARISLQEDNIIKVDFKA